jgi:hypothetical protein
MDWEEVREEVCTKLEIGMSQGETELDTVTRLVWIERQGNLGAIQEAVATALHRERRMVAGTAAVLQWKPRLHLLGPVLVTP